MIYYVCEGKPEGKYNAMSKARNDVINIEKDMKLEPLIISTKYGVRKNKFLKPLQLLDYHKNYKIWRKAIKKINKGDILIIQYPLVNTILNFEKIIKKCNYKKITTILLIHDLDSLRGTKLTRIIKEDKNVLNYSSYLIAHNRKMKEKLIEMGNNANKIVNLNIFDYLPNSKIIYKKRKKEDPIIIAGNLVKTKAKYLTEIKYVKNVRFNLYGKGYEKENDESNIEYKGAFLPEDLLNNLEGSFGLIWDGTSKDSCLGYFGDYLRYNNPHKTSLYLTAGIPVIVWNESAMADFVLENNVGITIKNLDEISAKIDQLSENEYKKMQKNAEKISYKLRNGYFLKEALKSILNNIKEKNNEKITN